MPNERIPLAIDLDDQFEAEMARVITPASVMTDSEFQARREIARLNRELAAMKAERSVSVNMAPGSQRAITQTVIVEQPKPDAATMTEFQEVIVGILGLILLSILGYVTVSFFVFLFSLGT